MAKQNAADAASSSLKYDVVRKIVVPTMKLGESPVFVRMESKIEVRKKIEEGEEKTIEIARVTNLETGELVEIVVGTVLHSELNAGYPDDGYVGKSFRIKKNDVPGKRYKTYELDEIAVK